MQSKRRENQARRKKRRDYNTAGSQGDRNGLLISRSSLLLSLEKIGEKQDSDDEDEDGEDDEEEEEDDEDDDDDGEDEEEENQRRYDFRQRKTVVRYQAPLDGIVSYNLLFCKHLSI